MILDKEDKIVAVRAMRAYSGVKVGLHSFLTNVLDGGEW